MPNLHRGTVGCTRRPCCSCVSLHFRPRIGSGGGPTAWASYSHIKNPRLPACSGRHSRCLTASQRENHLSCLCPPWNTHPTGGPSKSRSRDWVTSLTGSVSIV